MVARREVAKSGKNTRTHIPHNYFCQYLCSGFCMTSRYHDSLSVTTKRSLMCSTLFVTHMLRTMCEKPHEQHSCVSVTHAHSAQWIKHSAQNTVDSLPPIHQRCGEHHLVRHRTENGLCTCIFAWPQPKTNILQEAAREVFHQKNKKTTLLAILSITFFIKCVVNSPHAPCWLGLSVLAVGGV